MSSTMEQPSRYRGSTFKKRKMRIDVADLELVAGRKSDRAGHCLSRSAGSRHGPAAQCAVGSAGIDVSAIGADGHRANRTTVALEAGGRLAVVRPPQPHCPVSPARD